MTISTQASQVILLGNGVTTTFNFPFVGAAAADIQVTYTDANNNASILSSSQYTLVLNAPVAGQLWGVGGTVTYPTAGPAIANGTSLTISRIVPLTQTVTISNQGDFAPQVIEQAMDLLELQIQQVAARTGQFRGTWATGIVYYGGDVVVDGANGANTGNFYMCALQNTSGTWATDLASGDWVLAYIGLTSDNIIAALGYTPMKGANNLGDLSNFANSRFNLGLGSIAVQNANSVAITGGTMSGVTITGHASLDLASANNLGDLSNFANSRFNLGLGSIAVQNANSVAITGGTASGLSFTGTIPFASATFSGEVDLNGTSFIAVGGSLTCNGQTDVKDGKFLILDSSDSLKQGAFSASAITSGNTRTLSFPDASGTIMLTSAIGSTVQAFDSDLSALAANSSNGLWARTGSGTGSARAVVGGGGITVTDGNGVAGSPTLSISNLRSLWLPARMWIPGTTSGATALATIGNGGGSVFSPDLTSINFTNGQYAQANIVMPKNWDGGNVQCKVYWSHAATVTNFGSNWAFAAQSFTDGDSMSGTGLAGTATPADTGGVADTLYITPLSNAFSLGSPAANSMTVLAVSRGSGSLGVPSRMHGVMLYYTINTLNEA